MKFFIFHYETPCNSLRFQKQKLNNVKKHGFLFRDVHTPILVIVILVAVFLGEKVRQLPIGMQITIARMVEVTRIFMGEYGNMVWGLIPLYDNEKKVTKLDIFRTRTFLPKMKIFTFLNEIHCDCRLFQKWDFQKCQIS